MLHGFPWRRYNHHYANTVMGKGMELVKTGVPDDHLNPMDSHDDANTLAGYRIVPKHVANYPR